MPRTLVIVNALLITVAAGSAVFIARQMAASKPLPAATSRPSAVAPAAPAEPPPRPAPDAYGGVASRSLFNPARSEAPAGPAIPAVSPVVKPNLFGVVLREGAPIAYLEDPISKRVAGYRVGDSVAGGTLQTISADSVVITRPDGKLDVRLRDPSRPRPAPVPVAVTPGVRAGTPAATLPGVIPPGATPGLAPQRPPIAPPQASTAPVPGPQPGTPTRRPLPPNLLRRLPQGAPPNAAQQ